MQIKLETQFGTQVVGLLNEHLLSMAGLSPPESVHALDLDGLKVPEVTFWCAWDGENLMGCGALKELQSDHAEIKSMRTAEQYLRRGVAAALLEHIVRTAENRGFARLSLETGSADAFLPAQSLYQAYGFKLCPPFADYVLDPHSIFMTLELPA